MKTKKIAAVVIGRNDNYGENLHHRARLCMANLTSQFDKVFYVDWKTLDANLIEASGIVDDKIQIISITSDYIKEHYHQYCSPDCI